MGSLVTVAHPLKLRLTVQKQPTRMRGRFMNAGPRHYPEHFQTKSESHQKLALPEVQSAVVVNANLPNAHPQTVDSH
jgi:hypothetical protein